MNVLRHLFKKLASLRALFRPRRLLAILTLIPGDKRGGFRGYEDSGAGEFGQKSQQNQARSAGYYLFAADACQRNAAAKAERGKNGDGKPDGIAVSGRPLKHNWHRWREDLCLYKQLDIQPRRKRWAISK
ncbi:hypothetical protein AB1287_07595 [Enterobacter asburiae]|uniref:hypothetical protein n=1 Tax=unclassified Scandinavium TaxID=2830652 RepID=UPI0028A0F297|nr:hypothetical protein [Scandinavium sp.]